MCESGWVLSFLFGQGFANLIGLVGLVGLALYVRETKKIQNHTLGQLKLLERQIGIGIKPYLLNFMKVSQNEKGEIDFSGEIQNFSQHLALTVTLCMYNKKHQNYSYAVRWSSVLEPKGKLGFAIDNHDKRLDEIIDIIIGRYDNIDVKELAAAMSHDEEHFYGVCFFTDIQGRVFLSKRRFNLEENKQTKKLEVRHKGQEVMDLELTTLP